MDFRTVMFILQWVGITMSGIFVYYSVRASRRARKSLEETRASLAEMEKCNKRLEEINKDLYLGSCCKCGIPKQLVCNDCLGVGKPETAPKYRSIDDK